LAFEEEADMCLCNIWNQ